MTQYVVRFDSEKREWCKGEYVTSMYLLSTVALIDDNPIPKKERKNHG